MSHSAKHSHLSPDRLIRSDTNWNVLTRTEKRQAWLQNRVPRVQVLLPLPYLDNEIDVHPLKPVSTGFIAFQRAKKSG